MKKILKNLLKKAFGSLLPAVVGNWRILLIAVAASATIGAVGGWRMHNVFYKADQFDVLLTSVNDFIGRETAAEQRARALQAKIQEMQAQSRKLKAKMEKEIAKNPIYADCILPDDGLRLLNEAITGHPAR